MKKSLLLFLSVWILAVGGCIYIQATLFQAREDVKITETILYGDKLVAEGVTVTQKTKYSEYLHWDTTYKIGEQPQVMTESQFSEMRLEDNPLTSFGITLEVDYETSRYPHLIEEKDYTGMSYAFLELAEETPNGESRQKTIYLKDYMEYYPINVMINLPENINIDTTETSLGNNQTDSIAQKFSECIKIPVLDEEMRHIEVSKSEDGTVASSGSSWVEGKDSFYFTTFHTYTDKACYFTFDTHTQHGNRIDISHMPDGYGIYAFSYDNKNNSIDADSLRNVYPLEPEVHILNLETDAENEHLLLFTKKDTDYMLTVINIETMQVKQELVFEEYPKSMVNFSNEQNGEKIGNKKNDQGGENIESAENTETVENNVQEELTEDYTPQFWMYDDFFIIQYEENTLTIVTKNNEMGMYQVEYTVKWEKDSPLVTTEELAWGDCHFNWNGKELVMCSSLYAVETIFKECGFFISVFDETGLIFLGRYDSSLNTGSYSDEEYDTFAQTYDIATESYYYMYECQPRRQNQLDVSW